MSGEHKHIALDWFMNGLTIPQNKEKALSHLTGRHHLPRLHAPQHQPRNLISRKKKSKWWKNGYRLQFLWVFSQIAGWKLTNNEQADGLVYPPRILTVYAYLRTIKHRVQYNCRDLQLVIISWTSALLVTLHGIQEFINFSTVTDFPNRVLKNTSDNSTWYVPNNNIIKKTTPIAR